MKPMKFGVGQAVRRIEDVSFITGEGRYLADLVTPETLRLVVVRSPHAHAEFALTNVSDIREMPGVRLVLTAHDVEELGRLPTRGIPKNQDGSPVRPVERPVLAKDVVCHVGDPVAAVIADTLEQAQDAAAALEVDWRPREAMVSVTRALEVDAKAVHPSHGSNLAYDAFHGDREKTEEAFAKAAHVVKLDLVNNRLVANYLETRGVLAEWNAETNRYSLAVGSQGVHGIRDNLCDHVFKIPREAMVVTTPDVGGGFGPKIFLYAEYALALVAAKKAGVPVAWISDRREHFVGCAQGRDTVSTAELALDAEHRFLGLRVDTLSNVGAYAAQYGLMIQNTGATMLPGLYRLPCMAIRVRGVYTNTVPVDAYRGAGRPEALYLIERLVDVAARDLGVAPEDLRLKNFVTPAELPYATASGRNYDSGEFSGHLEQALKTADQAGFENRRRASEAKGLLRGFGFASYIECCAFGAEDVTVRLETSGRVTVLVGTQSNGQGHKTAYAQMVAQHLDLDPDMVDVVQGDSDLIPTGAGTGGSRSIPVGGVAVARAAEDLASKLLSFAAEVFGRPVGDLQIGDGTISVPGTNHVLSLAALAALPQAKAERRTGKGAFKQPEATYPNGTHVSEVEIDPQTGLVKLVAYTVVDDFGVTLNPMLLAGQIHGGVAQGVGQALLEHTIYDDAGNLLTGSFQDYCVPRAHDMVMIDFETRNVPSTTNAMGMKGAGEAGTIGACPAVMNAVMDALGRRYGIRHLDMPATPQRVWRAIREVSA
ncbi:carbon monoxide dehydrogenase [Agaricicola taiwanensis]|uniref:Carbon monoxide dehydrogenase n=1 Tax=Agaricicola taiwanensis TaxID=591372 RepID=A0A8J2YHD2_9RHOB|nr:xanthine dehydrogenase family protein molybdopterin-binding subunit [Agaricicola taiwanensis]GGE42857.1 carbon monoxide dehydrogenase [Agaricicola taiwanensis]